MSDLVERLRTASSLAQALPACREAAGRIEQLEILVAKMERAIKAANIYYGCYLQDVAEDIEYCVSTEQHEAAKELRAALRIAVAALMARRAALAPEQEK